MRFTRSEHGITTSYKLEIPAERKGNHADHSAFFPRRKWTLEEAYQFVHGLMGLVFVYKVLVPLWFPWDTPESPLLGSAEYPAALRGAKRFEMARPLHDCQ
jgi:hypothetical protein